MYIYICIYIYIYTYIHTQTRENTENLHYILHAYMHNMKIHANTALKTRHTHVYAVFTPFRLFFW